MKCKNCKELMPINGFSGYSHFQSTKKSMDNNVKNGFFKVVEKNQYETIYQCTTCQTKWVLAEPDFPVMGYFIEQ